MRFRTAHKSGWRHEWRQPDRLGFVTARTVGGPLAYTCVTWELSSTLPTPHRDRMHSRGYRFRTTYHAQTNSMACGVAIVMGMVVGSKSELRLSASA